MTGSTDKTGLDEAHQGERIAIRLNGEPATTAATTLSALIVDLGLGDARIATALNGVFVPAKERQTRRLASGDSIEIVSPRQGG